MGGKSMLHQKEVGRLLRHQAEDTHLGAGADVLWAEDDGVDHAEQGGHIICNHASPRLLWMATQADVQLR